jgi:hypothetical protein
VVLTAVVIICSCIFLAEDLEKSSPRPKSPYMDNEEPIEMAHYPGGRVPDPNVVPAIERDDFPAPPYPYAVEGRWYPKELFQII